MIDGLDLVNELYNIIVNEFKNTYKLDFFDICFEKIKLFIYSQNKNDDSICKMINNRLYIVYYNIHKNKKIIKSKYKNIDDLFETIKRSCFIPFVSNGDLVYKNKYFDGVNPYIFPEENKIQSLYLDLFGNDKIHYLFSIKNEKTNFHRILTGLLDIHLFSIKKCSTQMCSYVNEWSFCQIIHNRVLKKICETMLFYNVIIMYYLKKYLPIYCNKNIIFKIISKIIKDVYVIILDNYTF